MKKILLIMFLSCLYLLTNFSTSYALSPIDQVCSTGVATSNTYSFIGSNNEMYQVFVPTKNTLDAVSVRVRTEIGESSNILIRVLGGSSAPAQIIAEGNATVGRQEEWLMFDFEDVEMPMGEYAIYLKSTDEHAHAIWKGINGNQYDRGFAVMNNQADLDVDFGFAVYAYDKDDNTTIPANNTEPENTNNPEESAPSENAPSDPQDLESANVSQDINSYSDLQGNPSIASNTSKPFTAEEASDIAKEISKGNSDGNIFLYGLVQLGIPLLIIGSLTFIFIIGLVLFLLLLKRNRRSNLIKNQKTSIE